MNNRAVAKTIVFAWALTMVVVAMFLFTAKPPTPAQINQAKVCVVDGQVLVATPAECPIIRYYGGQP